MRGFKIAMAYRVAIKTVCAGSIVAAMIAFANPVLAAADATGIWMSDKGDGATEIRPCSPQSTTLCGYIYSILKIPNPDKPWVDGRNETVELRNRPLCDLPVLGALTRESQDTWGGGWVYDPNVGKTYSVELTLQDPNTLAVRGYKAVKLLGRTVVWTRATKPPPRCPKDKAAPAAAKLPR
jgi:uncharacterized protein (DUF2147 family)